jgi:hypothetical protein
VVKCGELWDKSGVDPNSFDAPQSCAYIMSNPTTTHGRPLGIKPRCDLEENSVNEKGVVVETSTHSINIKRGGPGRGDKTVSPRYHNGWFLLAGPY